MAMAPGGTGTGREVSDAMMSGDDDDAAAAAAGGESCWEEVEEMDEWCA
jgi:hypothetical protein